MTARTSPGALRTIDTVPDADAVLERLERFRDDWADATGHRAGVAGVLWPFWFG